MAKIGQRCGKSDFGLSWLVCALGAMGLAPAQTVPEIVLHNFGGPTAGAFPTAGLIRDSAGNLYGTTSNEPVVYKLSAAGKYTALCSLGGPARGYHTSPATSTLPDFTGVITSGVITDSAGHLYGTDGIGNGVVYELVTAGQETVLYTFTGGADGGGTGAGVIRDSSGNLYGTASGGLIFIGNGVGVVYMLNPAGQQTVLWTFLAYEGAEPLSGLIQDAEGNLYGTANQGGAANLGDAYEIDTGGNFSILYSFMGGTDGANPYSGLIMNHEGYFFGTTWAGGTGNSGTVYKLAVEVLYSFTGGADGGNPYAGLVQDSAGNFYGTTYGGGTAGQGVVYALIQPTTRGGPWTEKVLHSFTGGADGGYPYAGVILDSEGNVYGTTYSGGKYNSGVVYMLKGAATVT